MSWFFKHNDEEDPLIKVKRDEVRRLEHSCDVLQQMIFNAEKSRDTLIQKIAAEEEEINESSDDSDVGFTKRAALIGQKEEHKAALNVLNERVIALEDAYFALSNHVNSIRADYFGHH